MGSVLWVPKLMRRSYRVNVEVHHSLDLVIGKNPEKCYLA